MHFIAISRVWTVWHTCKYITTGPHW